MKVKCTIFTYIFIISLFLGCNLQDDNTINQNDDLLGIWNGEFENIVGQNLINYKIN